ncbi:MAG: glycosyltransferase family protein [Candidatus Dormibacteraeota bacterium]|nr:glycosyltransferase family protein [Candidatus Dormibacteraeota bacterium]
MTTVAIVQARMGSTRFPGKVLADLAGRPMLAHIVDRVTRAATVDRVVVATSVDPSDDAVAALAADCGALVTRGPVEDVLTRFVQAVREHGGDVVLRITADCPLVDPDVIDEVVRRRAEQNVEYAGNVDPATFPDGYDVEVMTTACLWRLDVEALAPHQREHVTARIRERPGEFTTANVAWDRDVSSMRLTVDVPDDLRRVAAVLAALPTGSTPGVRETVALLDADPTLREQDGLPERDERYRAQRDAARRQETTA